MEEFDKTNEQIEKSGKAEKEMSEDKEKKQMKRNEQRFDREKLEEKKESDEEKQKPIQETLCLGKETITKIAVIKKICRFLGKANAVSDNWNYLQNKKLTKLENLSGTKNEWFLW